MALTRFRVSSGGRSTLEVAGSPRVAIGRALAALTGARDPRGYLRDRQLSIGEVLSVSCYAIEKVPSKQMKRRF